MDSPKNVRVETDTFGPIEVEAHRYWGAQTQRSLQNFKIGGERMPPALVRALGIVKLAAARVNGRLGELDGKLADAIARAAQEVADGKLDRRVPARRLADRLRHPDQHERQRGDRQPRQRAARRRARRQVAGPPQRPRQSRPVVQRHLPDRDARRRGRAGRARAGAGARAPARRAAQEAGRVQGHHQDRPHAPAGRDAPDPGPGVLGLRHPGRQRHRPGEGGPAARLRAGPGRHRRRHRPQRQEGLRRGVRGRGGARSPACRS